ncbi:tyrosine-protein phosphatase non-receptor type 1 [Pieris rapae]|uniref:tyrosine-protein phosphatase non-receptor type 1 n=1 Tax=Pieris rapae TaxID=64459 RepID=UPI001E280A92|nr:tyrosine-protein phosphatase non-receptor type 1 [Pieris rapae]
MALTNIEKEYEDFVKNNSWLLIYYKICREGQPQYLSALEAKKPRNKHLNRYRDVSPYDHTRVKLNRIERDYINANFVNIPSAKRSYILTQGPLAATMGHFWLMVWEQCSTGIVMLNKLIENKETKCHQYWPGEEGLESIYEDVQLAVTLISEQNKNYYILRKFKLQDLESKETRDVLQFHYITWPDFKVPKSPTQFLDFLNDVWSSGILESSGPPIIHCSAGIGRSGTFCLVDSTLFSMESQGVDNVDPKEIMKIMRTQRMGLIQNTDQFRFCYLAIIEGVKRFDPNYKKAPIEEINSEVDDTSSETLNLDPSCAPPLPPRGASLETSPCFGPLPPVPVDSNQDDLYSSSDSSEFSSPLQSPLRFGDIKDKEKDESDDLLTETRQDGPTLRAKARTQNMERPLRQLLTPEPEKKPKKPKWLPMSIIIALGIVVIGFIYVYY